jgi:transcriptional regulator with XRE-family HTH domain
MCDGATPSIDQRRELGSFLVSRRARLQPHDVGLPAGRRRTRGLRREEVALLAGVSVSWYTWLEQGRDIHVSPAVLTRISEVLRLTRAEVVHLFALACELAPPEPLDSEVTGNLKLLVDAVEPFPAYVLNNRWDILAWNPACAELFLDFGALVPHERNALRLLLVHPTYRSLIVNWETLARGCMESFRVARSKSLDKRRFDELVHVLSTCSPEFKKWWPDQDVQMLSEGVERFDHPTQGLLDVPYVFLVPEGNPDLTLITFFPKPIGDSRL